MNRFLELRISLDDSGRNGDIPAAIQLNDPSLTEAMKMLDGNGLLDGYSYLGIVHSWEVEVDEQSGRRELVIKVEFLD